MAQIPVAWAIAKGTLPIIGVTKTSHVEDAVKASSVTLTAEETAELEKQQTVFRSMQSDFGKKR